MFSQSEEFEISGPRRFAENPHLAAGVIVVVFAEDIVAGRLEETGDGVAEDGLTAVADAQRAGGVGADELHHHLPAAADCAGAEVVAAFEDLRNHAPPDLGLDEDIDEARPGHLQAIDEIVLSGQQLDDLCRELAGVAFFDAGQNQGHIG